MRAARLILISATALAAAACGSSHKPPPTASSTQTASASQPAPPSTTARASIRVNSDFTPGGVIPRSHTCDGQDVSPPLRATGIPAGTKELVVVMVDHDAGDFMHWGIAHLTPHSSAVPAGAKPAGAVLGRNGFGSLGYRGPCPPAGDSAHHYEITVYALSRPSKLKPGFSAGAVSGLPVLASGSLTGLYARR
jgi:Raf kinase inhibitor-like YbhB/YbcL family protein